MMFGRWGNTDPEDCAGSFTARRGDPPPPPPPGGGGGGAPRYKLIDTAAPIPGRSRAILRKHSKVDETMSSSQQFFITAARDPNARGGRGGGYDASRQPARLDTDTSTSLRCIAGRSVDSRGRSDATTSFGKQGA